LQAGLSKLPDPWTQRARPIISHVCANYAQERLFDQRQLARVFYRDNGVNRYAIIGRPDNTREDDLEWLILTSELQIRTGLMDTAERLLQSLQR
jgi:hypothetical protein